MNTRPALASWCLIAPVLAVSSGCECAGYHARRGPEDPAPNDDPADCESDPTGTGCACDAIEPLPCFDGEPLQQGVGICSAGLRTCMNGIWGYCEGEVLAQQETCDELDNDCDSEVDEGVQSACGDCNEDCREIAYGDRE